MKAWFQRWRRALITTGALLLVGAFALVDWLAGPELSSGILYLVPVMLCACVGERWQRLTLCVVSGCTWLVGELRWSSHFTEPWVPYWNAALCLGVFILASELTARTLRQNAALEAEVAERKRVELNLRELNETLEEKVANRTVELERIVQERTAKLMERAALLELSFDAIIVRDSEDRITFWNRGAEEMYGWRREEVYGKVTHQLFQTEFPESLPQLLAKFRQAGRWSGVLSHSRRNGERMIIATRWAMQLDSTGKAQTILEINTDITEQKHTEEALRRNEQELAIFFEESPLGLMWIDPEGKILRINRAALAIFGREAPEIQGRSILGFEADPKSASQLLARVGKGETVRNFRLHLRNEPGELRHVLVDANALFDHGFLAYSRWFLRDITRHLELEQQILDISEREQRRLGQDLHDDLCQQLTGIEFLCQRMATELMKRSKAQAAQAKQIAGMVRLAMVQTRELARGLSPLSLDTDGLMVALGELADRTTRLFGRECRFVCAPPVPVPDQTVGVHVYRIAQEAVANALKHSKCRKIVIELISSPPGFSLRISDDGTGISTSPVGRGMGLRIMQYRAEILGGSLTVRSNVQGGTSITCDICDVPPLQSHRIDHDRT